MNKTMQFLLVTFWTLLNNCDIADVFHMHSNMTIVKMAFTQK